MPLKIIQDIRRGFRYLRGRQQPKKDSFPVNTTASGHSAKSKAQSEEEPIYAYHPVVLREQEADGSLGVADLGSFSYDNLPRDHFRLIRILRAENTTEIEMTPLPIENSPKYMAVSYCWGTDRPLKPIICNGQRTFVTPSIHQALIHFRSHFPDRSWFWIDSVSIDQHNDEEKAHQVAQMHKVYSGAVRVVIWLGLPSSQIDKAFQHFEEIYATAVRAERMEEEQKISRRELKEMAPECFKDFGLIYMNPYFQRGWIVQEILLSVKTSIICGSHLLDWESFRLILRVASELDWILYILPQFEGKEAEFWQAMTNTLQFSNEMFNRTMTRDGSLNRQDFLEFLHYSRFRLVTEPVDRVWAFGSLADPELRRMAEPFIDYSPQGRSEYGITFMAFIRLLLSQYPWLDALGMAPSYSVKPPGIPSWCANFCDLPAHENVLGLDFQFSAGGLSSQSSQIGLINSISSNILSLQGVIFDTVDEVLQGVQWPTSEPEQVMIMEQEWLELAQKTLDELTTVPEAYLRTITFNERNWSSDESPEKYQAHISHLHSDEFDSNSSDPGSFTDLRTRSIRRPFFSTKANSIGIGSITMLPGDTICIFLGGRVPYILRKVSNSENWVLVGEAYVDGIMEGEALSQGREKLMFDII